MASNLVVDENSKWRSLPTKTITLAWQARDIIESNLIAPALLKRTLLWTKRHSSLSFMAWLVSMTFEANWPAVKSHDPQQPGWRWCYFCLAVGQVCIILWVALSIEHSSCLKCSKRHSQQAALDPERRDVGAVYFVLSPAFGSSWLVLGLQHFQHQATMLVARIFVQLFGYLYEWHIDHHTINSFTSQPECMSKVQG